MKKTTRVLVALLALTLVTSCFVGGTFAKYVVTGSATDNARVAQFGVTIDVVADGAFAAEYDATVTKNDEGGNAIAKTVVANDGDNLVAPGTGAAFGSLAIEGETEVAVTVTKTADLVLGGAWVADGAYYCPLKITIGSDTFYGMDYASITEFEEAVEGAVNSEVNYAPNETLDFATTASWAWDFEGTDGKQTDAKDTALGNAADAGDITIALTWGATVTQID